MNTHSDTPAAIPVTSPDDIQDSGFEDLGPDTAELESSESESDAFEDLSALDASFESATAESATAEPAPIVSVSARSGPGWVPVVLLAALSAGAGALGGYALADADPFADLGPDDRRVAMQDEISALQRADSALREQLAELERAPRPDALLERLDDRLAKLEARPATAPGVASDAFSTDVVDQLRTRLDALEDAQLDTEAPAGSPSTSSATSRRFRELENRLGQVEAAVESAAPATPVAALPTVSYRVGIPSAEAPSATMPADDAPAADTPSLGAPDTDALRPLPAFPYGAVDAALDEPTDNGFLRRLVRVRDADAEAALDDLREALDDGDVSAALRAFDRLPRRARNVGSDWAVAARASVETR